MARNEQQQDERINNIASSSSTATAPAANNMAATSTAAAAAAASATSSLFSFLPAHDEALCLAFGAASEIEPFVDLEFRLDLDDEDCHPITSFSPAQNQYMLQLYKYVIKEQQYYNKNKNNASCNNNSLLDDVNVNDANALLQQRLTRTLFPLVAEMIQQEKCIQMSIHKATTTSLSEEQLYWSLYAHFDTIVKTYSISILSNDNNNDSNDTKIDCFDRYYRCKKLLETNPYFLHYFNNINKSNSNNNTIHNEEEGHHNQHEQEQHAPLAGRQHQNDEEKKKKNSPRGRNKRQRRSGSSSSSSSSSHSSEEEEDDDDDENYDGGGSGSDDDDDDEEIEMEMKMEEEDGGNLLPSSETTTQSSSRSKRKRFLTVRYAPPPPPKTTATATKIKMEEDQGTEESVKPAAAAASEVAAATRYLPPPTYSNEANKDTAAAAAAPTTPPQGSCNQDDDANRKMPPPRMMMKHDVPIPSPNVPAAIPIISTSAEADWEERLQDLIQYKSEHGNTLVPTTHEVLGRWVQLQRNEMKRLIDNEGLSLDASTVLSPSRVQKLNSIAFVWIVPSDFNNEHDKVSTPTLPPPPPSSPNNNGDNIDSNSNDDGKDNSNSNDNSNSSSGADSKRKVPTTGVPWDVRFQQLQDYKHKNGHCKVHFGSALGGWCRMQRSYRKIFLSQKKGQNTRKHCPLTESRIQKLNAIDFIWDVTTTEDSNNTANQEKVDDNGDANSTHCSNGEKDDCAALYANTAARPSSCNSEYDEDKNKAVEDRNNINRVSSGVGSKRIGPNGGVPWDVRFEQLQDNEHLIGHSTLTSKTQLGRWCAMQRSNFKWGRLSKSQIQKLNSIGFVWDLTANEDSKTTQEEDDDGDTQPPKRYATVNVEVEPRDNSERQSRMRRPPKRYHPPTEEEESSEGEEARKPAPARILSAAMIDSMNQTQLREACKAVKESSYGLNDDLRMRLKRYYNVPLDRCSNPGRVFPSFFHHY